ncbi:DUF1592 domain-containing protein [Pseudomonas sp. HLS-6 TE3448]
MATPRVPAQHRLRAPYLFFTLTVLCSSAVSTQAHAQNKAATDGKVMQRPSSSQFEPGKQASAEACKAEQYALDAVKGQGKPGNANAGKTLKYQQGAWVTNVGHAFECWKDSEAPYGVGSWAWCNQPAYAPGQSANWGDAWKDLGECNAAPSSNKLELSFSTVTRDFPNKATTLGVGPGSDIEVTGVLRCKGESVPIAGKSNTTLTIEGLKACDYDLIMDPAQGYLPLTTPNKVSFTQESGEKQQFAVKYRPPVDISQLRGLPGIKVELFAQGLSQPRQMAMGNKVLYVGSSAIPNYVYDGRTANFIYALPLNDEGKPTGIYLVASGLEEPHGVAYRDGDLFYSTTGGVYRVRNIDSTYTDPKPERVITFPADDTLVPLVHPGYRIWHQKHPLKFNPVDPTDKGLYTAVGIPCNLCMIPGDPRYGTVLRYDLETGKSEILAKGVRNSVGFDWNPDDHKIWFSDNNRQGFPNADEINRIARSAVKGKNDAMHFGVPYVFGRSTPGFTADEFNNPGDTQPPLVKGAIISDKPLAAINQSDHTPPAYELGSNTAPLGIKFWKPNPLFGQGIQPLLVATHGVGATGEPGLEIRMLGIQNNSKVVNQIPLINGWVKDPNNFDVYCLTNSCVGRPADFLELADKSLLVSDDVAGVIYRVSFDAKEWMQAGTVLHLQPTVVPDAHLADQMVSGTLKDPDGHTRMFQVAWNTPDFQTPDLQIYGLKPGTYEVRLNDVADWIPVQRTTNVTFASNTQAGTKIDTQTRAVKLEYRKRPTHVEVEATLKAPAKPASVNDAFWKVTVLSKSAGAAPREVQVPWGGQAKEILNYGEYDFIYPYYPKELPEPTKTTVSINEDSNNIELTPITYRAVTDLGQEVLATSCSTCHSPDYFNDQNKATTWNVAGSDALVKQIMSMPVSGHCDVTCASEISRHLFDVVWAPYLNPAESYGKRQLRLLTPLEYANSVQDLFGVTINTEKLPADKSPKTFKYPGDADHGLLQADDVKSLYDMAWFVANAASANTETLADLGHKVFRRPLSNEERTRYQRLKDEHGQTSLIAALLLSPNFLYRSELGVADAQRSGTYTLTPSETATALSFAILGTTPDIALLRKAEQGLLNTPEQISAQVDEMLRSDRGVEQFNRFISYYIKTNRGAQEKPGLSASLVQDMAAEQYRLVREVMTNGNGSFNALFNPGYTFLNQALAEHYGISGVSGNEMRKVTVDDRRGGLLHLGLTQAATSDYQATSLVKRGIMVREQLFCREFGAPVDTMPGEPTFPAKAVTTRERWDLVNGKEASQGSCWQCHQYMNDTGASMEHYDATGRYRTEENAYNYGQYPVKLPINAAGPFVDNTGLIEWAHVQDVRDIARLIPTNNAAQSCMANSYIRFAFGNEPDAGTAGTLNTLAEGLKTSGSLTDMIRNLATSNAFLHKKGRE